MVPPSNDDGDVVEPDAADAATDAVSCTPGQLFCVDHRQRALCDDDGGGWKGVGFCHIPNACDPETVECLPILCTVDAGFCPESALTGSCNSTGTAFTIGDACEHGSSCRSETGTCQTWVCEPNSLTCGAEGELLRCWANGLGEYVYGDCDEDDCFTCVHAGKAEASCVGVAPGDPAVVTDCFVGEACFISTGCRNLDCPKLLESCDDDGHELACEALNSCVPLPALGLSAPDSSDSDSPASDATQLTVSFSVGTAEDGGSQFITLNPVINPQSGSFLDGLVPVSEIDGVGVGNIELTEDGVPLPLECAPLLQSPEARSDLVFVIDSTGSMEQTISTAQDSAVELAGFLAEQGLDMRFGAVEFRDDSDPAADSWFFDLNASAAKLEAFIATLQADGGADEPENPLDAIHTVLNEMSWRPGATRVIVLFTDASMHVPADGTGFASHDLVEVVSQLVRYVTVHTVSSSLGDEICLDHVHPNPRLLSCATGGTASRLETFNVGSVKQALFAQALAESQHCTFQSADPTVPHDVEVTVRDSWNGSQLEGSALQPQQSYD